MFRPLLLVSTLLALILVPGGFAQDDDKPTIAFLRYAGTAPVAEATNGILDSLEAYGYLSSAERAALNESYDLIGENINLLYRDAGFDLPSVNLMVEEVLDKGADAIVTITTQVAQIAVNATPRHGRPAGDSLQPRHHAFQHRDCGFGLHQTAACRGHAAAAVLRRLCAPGYDSESRHPGNRHDRIA